MKEILVVDDLPDLADSTAALLELMGYRTRTAYDGKAAVLAVRDSLPDVVLLDLNMPVLDGFAAAQAIRAASPLVRPLLVATSAMIHPDLDQRLKACGFDHYLTKPVDIADLVSLIERAP